MYDMERLDSPLIYLIVSFIENEADLRCFLKACSGTRIGDLLSDFTPEILRKCPIWPILEVSSAVDVQDVFPACHFYSFPGKAVRIRLQDDFHEYDALFTAINKTFCYHGLKLIFCWTRISSESISSLAKHLACCPNLTSIEFPMAMLKASGSGTSDLVSIVRTNPSVKFVSLGKANVDDEVADCITPESCLERLDLSFCRIGSSLGRRISQNLEFCKSLRVLDLSHCDLEDSGCRYLASPVSLSNLTHLNIAGNHLENITEFAKVIPRSKLKSLDFSRNRLCQASIKALAANMAQLEELYLIDVALSKSGLIAIVIMRRLPLLNLIFPRMPWTLAVLKYWLVLPPKPVPH